MHLDVAVAEELFVDNSQKCILNSRSCFPYLVEKDHVGRRQISVGGAHISVGTFQLTDAHRTENLVGSRKP